MHCGSVKYQSTFLKKLILFNTGKYKAALFVLLVKNEFYNLGGILNLCHFKNKFVT
jgi:hypothetical protein